MFKVVDWHYGKRYIQEFDTFDKAKGYFENTENSFAECLLDENNEIVVDRMRNVIGAQKNRVGEVYFLQ